MAEEVKLDYDEAKQAATITFAGGRTLKLANVTRQRAEQFLQRMHNEYANRAAPVGLDLTRECCDG